MPLPPVRESATGAELSDTAENAAPLPPSRGFLDLGNMRSKYQPLLFGSRVGEEMDVLGAVRAAFDDLLLGQSERERGRK
mgnify:CR=1 FL=1